MDFVTQNLLGAVAGHAFLGKSAKDEGLGRLALLAGAMGGALPDFDFLLRRFADPALPFEMHRHFTHALVAIPLGGLIAAAPLLLIPRCRRRFGLTLAATTIGCATHGLLDNLTSYGTHLLWPFFSERTAWDAMSIIDPIFTGLLFLGLLVALVRDSMAPTRLALGLCAAYIAFGFVQHERGMAAQRSIALSRGHEITHGRVLPTLGNIVVFRSVYEADGRIWADAIRLSPTAPPAVRAGSSVQCFDVQDWPVDADDRTLSVLRGIEAFADGFLARVDDPAAPDGIVLGDMRLSGVTDGFMPLWGVAFDEGWSGPRAWSGMHRSSPNARSILGELADDLFRPEGRFRSLDALEPASAGGSGY